MHDTRPSQPATPPAEPNPFALPPAIAATMGFDERRRALALSWALAQHIATPTGASHTPDAERIVTNAQRYERYLTAGGTR